MYLFQIDDFLDLGIMKCEIFLVAGGSAWFYRVIPFDIVDNGYLISFILLNSSIMELVICVIASEVGVSCLV